uniref:Transmembrane protein n=1 Tax=Globodera rostochiensis TaxID=31243 RepID=A0A914I4X8_GLORO
MKFFVVLFFFVEFIGIVFANLAQQRKLCSNRCHRLLRRSLERVEGAGTVEEILYQISAYRRQQILASVQDDASSATFEEPSEPFRNICWKFFDFEDCSSQCEKAFFRRRKRKNDKERADPVGLEQQMVLQFCHRNDFGVPYVHFSCIHKFHAFVEVRCSAYQQKAVELRLMAFQLRRGGSVDEPKVVGQKQDDDVTVQDDEQQLSNAINQEMCLLLHQHSTCLGNALGRHCPFARGLFATRHALRDNFLSFVLPFGTAADRRRERNAKSEQDANLNGAIELDRLFSDEMLDTCHLLDFNRMATQWKEQRELVDSPNSLLDRQQQQQQMNQNRGTTKRAIGTMPEGTTAVPSGRRRVFSSDEELLDIPPNFQYSTARLPPDFYTRYAIWWGGRSRAQPLKATPSTLVQLLAESTSTVTEQHSTWPHTAASSGGAMRETLPDTMLTTSQLPRQEEETVRIVSLPYMINGQATVPSQRWWTEEANAGRRTEEKLRLSNNNDQWASTTTAAGYGRTQTATVPNSSTDTQSLSELWPRNLPNDKDEHLFNGLSTAEDNSDKYSTIEHIVKDDGQHRHISVDGKVPKSSASKQHSKVTESALLPQLREDINSVYFAKILQFGEEDDGQSDGTYSEEQYGGRVTAHMEHLPREQLQPSKQKVEADQSLEADQDGSSGEDYFGGDDDDDLDRSNDDFDRSNDDLDRSGDEDESASEERDISYKISAAASIDPDRFSTAPPAVGPGLADLSHKTRGPHDTNYQPMTRRSNAPRRILVSAEPVPVHSDVLLVLFGLYGTFFGVAAFLLLCLLMACLERRRRRHGALLGRYRRKYRSNSSATKGGRHDEK